MRILSFLGYLLTLSLSISQVCHADQAQSTDADQAKQLLERAVDYYQVQGDASLAAFSRQGEFIEEDRYVFVVDTHGMMLASGGPSAVLIGRDVSKVLAPELKEAFQKALGTSEDAGVQSAEYRWKNWADGRVERKQVFFRRVGERIIAVGHYLPRATPQQAEELLARAAKSIAADAGNSIRAINELSADFREDDLYVFVVDLETQRYVAHGYNLRLIGVNFATIKDPEGKPVGTPILAQMQKADSGGYDYRWKNPVTGKVEDKHALLRKVGHYLVAVGYYRESK
ncbi:cache domain-containing protein [Aquipseudomonas ullengensis]|uniref:Cache domain-containing protein n=1 Tax=Aquipseudomonas ullengensis TaxID=2759166 RepID=A0A7W4LI13_9GAMM|nr:cache domain-containing protein [Pseudomonas ullengensis]MBB2493553.1 cache domain-containing protein [Pseudomonas ullengensis]